MTADVEQDRSEEPMRVRVLLLSPVSRLLLFKYRSIQPSGHPRPCWTTAGGGREPGETIQQAALREIAEETGMRGVRLGPVVWYGEDGHRSGDWKLVFREHFIVAFADSEEIDTSGWTDHERREVLEFRWWPVEELRRTDEVIYPFGLADLLEPIVSGIYPDELVTLPPI
jgi:ADP-ribose pyrophosphatase YjhB (NUDIX family)